MSRAVKRNALLPARAREEGRGPGPRSAAFVALMLHTTSALALSALAMVAPSSCFSAASAISNLPHPGGSPQTGYVDLSLLKEADLNTPGKERACDHGGSASPSMDDKEARCLQPLADFFDWPKPSLTSSTFSSSPPAREVRCPGSNKQQHLCLPEFAGSCMIMRSGFGRSSSLALPNADPPISSLTRSHLGSLSVWLRHIIFSSR